MNLFVAKFLWILWIIVAVFAVLGIISAVVFAIVKMRKKYSAVKIALPIFAIVSFVIAAASWILNFGWIRFILTIMLIPIIHGIAYIIANVIFAKYTVSSSKMAKLYLFFIITFLVLYLFLPDGDDTGKIYFFFSLIQNDVLADIAYSISGLALVTHITLFVLQIIEACKMKKMLKKEN